MLKLVLLWFIQWGFSMFMIVNDSSLLWCFNSLLVITVLWMFRLWCDTPPNSCRGHLSVSMLMSHLLYVVLTILHFQWWVTMCQYLFPGCISLVLASHAHSHAEMLSFVFTACYRGRSQLCFLFPWSLKCAESFSFLGSLMYPWSHPFTWEFSFCWGRRQQT